jgi:hypothetical protein
MAADADPIAGAMVALLGSDAARIVAPALPAGAAIASLRVTQVLFRPESRVSVTYSAMLEQGDGSLVEEPVVAAADRSGLPPAATTSRAGDETVAVWRARADPLLPGIVRALDPDYAHRLLVDAGVGARGARVELRAYRPGRRAVVEVWPVQPEQRRLVFTRSGGGLRAAPKQDDPALYLKVLRPERAPEVAAVHGRLRDFVPAPPCSIADDAGILALGVLRGASLGACLRRGTPRAPDAGELIAVLERVGDAELPGSPGEDSDARLRLHTRLVAALLPDDAERLERLEASLSGAVRQPVVTIHGDFHEGNVLVGDGGVTGLLDVDDAGPGERVDDLGRLIGRIWTLGHGRAGEPALRYCEELLRRADARVDPGELRRRIGVALVGRATGPFRNQLDGWPALTRRRLDLAERWVAALR